MRPALGMPNDDVACAGVPQHRGGNVAGERPARLGRAILGPEAELAAFDPPRRLRDQGRGRADQQLGGAGVAASAARRIASISAKDPERPFIFQLPATNGRTPGVIDASRLFRRPGSIMRPRLCKTPGRRSIGRARWPEMREGRERKGGLRRNALIDAQRGSGSRRQGGHDRRHGLIMSASSSGAWATCCAGSPPRPSPRSGG